jgi:hypothetical protein
MLNLNWVGQADSRTLTFLEENPTISQSLMIDLGSNLHQVVTLIEPVLDAPQRCEASCHYYIQAVTTGRTAFLTTNLPDGHRTHVTEMGTSWLIGRSYTCAIALLEQRISRCHAAIGHYPNRGFYLMDLGTSNGTRVNGTHMVAHDQYFLEDGDILELANVSLQFFISGWIDDDDIPETQFG